MTTYQKRVPIPEPMREAPGLGAFYWRPDVRFPRHPDRILWYGNRDDNDALKAGLCCRTKKDAIERGWAMRMTEEE